MKVVEVEGTLVRPQGALILDRTAGSFNPLIRLRMDFEPELNNSVNLYKMKLSKQKLKQIIKEELSSVLSETGLGVSGRGRSRWWEEEPSEELLAYAEEVVLRSLVHSLLNLHLSDRAMADERGLAARTGKTKEELLQMYLEDNDATWQETLRFHIQKENRFSDINLMRSVYHACNPMGISPADPQYDARKSAGDKSINSVPEFQIDDQDRADPSGRVYQRQKCLDYVSHSGGVFVQKVVPILRKRISDKAKNIEELEQYLGLPK